MKMKLKILPPRPIGPHDRNGKALARLWRYNRRSWHRLMLPAVSALFYEALLRFAKESPSARLVELERSTLFTDLPTAEELGEAAAAAKPGDVIHVTGVTFFLGRVR